MSSSYNMHYERAHIPCTGPAAGGQHAVHNGFAKRNIDGQIISGGYMVNGVCVSNGTPLVGVGSQGPAQQQQNTVAFVANNVQFGIGGFGQSPSANVHYNFGL